jgi:hypothetical protein
MQTIKIKYQVLTPTFDMITHMPIIKRMHTRTSQFTSLLVDCVGSSLDGLNSFFMIVRLIEMLLCPFLLRNDTF